MRNIRLLIAAALLSACQRQEPLPVAATTVISSMRGAIRSATVLQYDFDIRVTGGERTNVRRVHGTVKFAPQRRGLLRIDATRSALEGENVPDDHYVLTSDGEIVTMRSEAKKKVFTTPVHRAGGLLLNARTLVPTRVFLDEWPISNIEKKNGFRLIGTAQHDGMICDVVRGEIPEEKKTVDLAVARADHLPRRMTIRSAEGAVDSFFSRVQTINHFDRGWIAVQVPAGFEVAEYTIGGPAVGAAAPSWTLDADGRPITLASLKGKVIILDFWATWCGPCRDSIPQLQKIYSEHRDRGLQVIGATWREDGDPAKFAKEIGVTYPHAKGDAIAAAYGVENSGIPTMYVIDRTGHVSDFFLGWSGDETAKALREAVERALG
jgi:thiol-disulfide isomerase/thioredoxin